MAKATCRRPAAPAPDQEPTFEVRVDHDAPRGNVLPVLARLLLELARRDAGAGEKGGAR
jgi:hypothetical protein